MPFGPNCGAQVPSHDEFCRGCGRDLPVERLAGIIPQAAGEALQTLPYEISLTRVFFMTVLSYGLYLFYWFYLTWKQYRDHTQTEAFPVWHALTLLVPIYNLFRIHAHMRSFKELMVNAGLHSTISAGWAVVLVLVSSALDWTSVGDPFGEITLKSAVVTTLLAVISVAIVTGLLLHVQENVNKYWHSLANVTVVNARIGVGEAIIGLVGVLAWTGTLATLLSSSYRMGP